MNQITNDEVIRFLRNIGRKLSRRAEKMIENDHPFAWMLELEARDGNDKIEAVIDVLVKRSSEDVAEFNAISEIMGYENPDERINYTN
jgi:hypothetical protein